MVTIKDLKEWIKDKDEDYIITVDNNENINLETIIGNKVNINFLGDSDEIEDLNDEISDLEDKILDLESDINVLESENSDLESKLNDIGLNVERLEKEIDRIEENLNDELSIKESIKDIRDIIVDIR